MLNKTRSLFSRTFPQSTRKDKMCKNHEEVLTNSNLYREEAVSLRGAGKISLRQYPHLNLMNE